MPGQLSEAALGRVFNAWRRALRHDPLLSRIPMPELKPFAEAFNSALTGEDEGELTVACATLVRANLDPATVIRITTILAGTFADETGTHSGAVTKSLVGTLGHVCELLTTTMVADVSEVARRDLVTGLENRLAWEESLSAIMASGDKVAVAMIDLDGLKKINDDQGHLAGDSYLKRFATDLRDVVRERGRVYRFGGDEYGVLLRNASGEELDVLLNNVAAVEGVARFSFGIACSTEDGRDPDTLTKVADDRMYVMKREHKGAQDLPPNEAS